MTEITSIPLAELNEDRRTSVIDVLEMAKALADGMVSIRNAKIDIQGNLEVIELIDMELQRRRKKKR